MKELYFRSEEDPNFVDGLMEVSNEIEVLIYQIKMILGTTKGEVLGEVKFGANTQDMLFTYDIDVPTFNRSLIAQTGLYSEMAKDYQVEYGIKRVTTNNGGGDIGLVDVAINGKSIFGFMFK